MKILFISYYSELYGANRSLLTLVDYFKRNGYTVTVLLPSKGSMSEELNAKSIPYYTIPYFSQWFYYKKSIKYLTLPFLLIATWLIFPYLVFRVRKISPDVIYSNSSAENMGVFIAKFLKTKHVSHIREFMDLDYDAYFIGGRKLKKEFINRSDGVIFVSNAVAKYVNMGSDLAANQAVIYNGVSTLDKPLEYAKILDSRILKFGLVGIFDPAKGQLLAIDYFSQLLKFFPNSELHLYGDKEGGYKKELLKAIGVAGLENKVILHGFVSNADEIYNDMDILLMFSRSEGFGRVTIEAMQRGIPVLGLKAGGTTELIVDRQSGALFNTKEEFIRGVKYLIEDEIRFNEIRKFTKQYACEKFSYL